MKTKFLRKFVGSFFAWCLVLALTSSVSAQIIYQAENEFGPLWVDEDNNVRILTFVPDFGVYQSIIRLDQPLIVQLDYIKFLLSGLFLNKAPDRILLLGLGGGTAARALNLVLPSSKLDIVEINPLIPQVAERFFLFKPNSNTKITVADGYSFVLNSVDSRYDLIILDAFDRDYIPAPFLTDKFVKNVKRILKKDGVVAVNTFLDSEFAETESRIYSEGFKSFFELTNNVSRVIIAKKGALPSLSQVKEKASNWAFILYQVGINAQDLAEKFTVSK